MKLNDILIKYTEKNVNNLFPPIAVGKYGIKKRDEIYKKQLASDYSKNKVIRKNTLTIGLGSNQIDIGVLYSDNVYSVSPAYNTFRINTNLVFPKYLEYYFKFNNKILSTKYMIASARQGKKVDISNLLSEDVNFPNKNIQEYIVNELNKINNIVEKYETIQIYFDELIKSRFIEMFGNGMFKEVSLSEISIIKSGHTIDIKKENEGGEIMYIKVSDMNLLGNEKYLKFSTKYVDRMTAGRIIYPKGTIIFPKNGGAVGTNKKRLSTQETTVDLNTMGVIPNSQKINSQYLYVWFLNFDLMSIATGSALPTISARSMGEQMLPLPPIELQNKFATFVEQIDKSKFIVKQQIKNLQELLDKKMDEYFNVE